MHNGLKRIIVGWTETFFFGGEGDLALHHWPEYSLRSLLALQTSIVLPCIIAYCIKVSANCSYDVKKQSIELTDNHRY